MINYHNADIGHSMQVDCTNSKITIRLKSINLIGKITRFLRKQSMENYCSPAVTLSPLLISLRTADMLRGAPPEELGVEALDGGGASGPGGGGGGGGPLGGGGGGALFFLAVS